MNLSRNQRSMLAGTVAWLVTGWSALAGPVPQTLPFSNLFSYAAGTTVQSLSNAGWDASSALVTVQTNVAYADTSSVVLPPDTALSNAVDHASPMTNVWTDFSIRMEPHGDTNDAAAASNAVLQALLDISGYLQVYDRTNGWLTLTNTVWGGPLAAYTNGQWGRVTIFQNYANQQCAVFLDGLLIKELLPFGSNVTACSRFRVDSGNATNSYFDNFSMARTIPATLTNNWDGVGLTDAQEVDAYGYLAMTLNVGPSQTYTTIQSAVNAALDRYMINVAVGTYTEDVTIAHSLAALTGGPFTVSGSVTIGTGAVVGTSSGMTCGNLGVAGAGSLTVTGNVTAGTVINSGTVAVAGNLTAAAVTVNAGGLLFVNGALSALHLSIGTGGRVVITNGTLQADGLTLSGSFTLDERWGNLQARSTLTFQDGFEDYQAGTPLALLGFRGWGASDSSVQVESSQYYSGSNGVNLGYGLTLSNRVDSAGAPQVWTDFRAIPTYDPRDLTTAVRSTAAFMAVVTNGYLGVYNGVTATWEVYTNDVWQHPLERMTGQWNRVSVLCDYGKKRCAVFVDGHLIRQRLPFINPNQTAYSGFSLGNDEANDVYLDDVYVGATYPPSLTNDFNNNGIPDAREILLPPPGTIINTR